MRQGILKTGEKIVFVSRDQRARTADLLPKDDGKTAGGTAPKYSNFTIGGCSGGAYKVLLS